MLAEVPEAKGLDGLVVAGLLGLVVAGVVVLPGVVVTLPGLAFDVLVLDPQAAISTAIPRITIAATQLAAPRELALMTPCCPGRLPRRHPLRAISQCQPAQCQLAQGVKRAHLPGRYRHVPALA